jgi:hypothetical protein
MSDGLSPPSASPRPGVEKRWPVWILVAWLATAAFIGFVLWGAYVVTAVGGVLGHCTGGAASHGSALAAAVLGGCLLLAVATVAAWRRDRLTILLGVFTFGYAVLCIGLGLVSPLFWGHRVC